MDEFIIFLVSLGSAIALLIVINVFLIWYSYKTNKKIDSLLEGGKIKSFKDIFLKQKEKNSKIEEDLKDAFLKIENLENISKKTIQKIGIIRFNPFNEMGGNQSFAIAFLDDQNNGIVVSSLFSKEGNRVYAKPIKQGKSEFLLSNEEEKAIHKATGGQG